MIPISRYTMIALAAAFSMYHIVRGAITLGQAESPWPSVVGFVIYGLVTVVVLWQSSPRTMPVSLASLVLSSSVIVTVLVTGQLNGAENNGFATWHTAAIGTLMTITAVRGRVWFAWAGVLFLTVHSIIWCGVVRAAEIGVTGAIAWVVIAQVMTRALDRAGNDAETLVLAEREAVKWEAAQNAHFWERRTRLEQASRVAGPLLRDIVLANGRLSDAERAEARLLEAGLRDEIRGRRLLDDGVRSAALAARRRGITVALLDEGTIDDLPAVEHKRILQLVASAISESTGERVIVRTAPVSSHVAVTIVGLHSPASGDEDDEDDVDLWLEIPRRSTGETGKRMSAEKREGGPVP